MNRRPVPSDHDEPERSGEEGSWYDDCGKLGDGRTTRGLTPGEVGGVLSFGARRAGGGDGCGVTTAGDAYGWGLNFNGQFGDGTTNNSSAPVLVLLP